jgi:putative NADH-flavin reductase
VSGPLLQAYVRELPKLEARDSLRRVTEIALGTGSLKADEQRRVLTEWELAAGYEPERRSQAQMLLQLQAMGLEVVNDG